MIYRDYTCTAGRPTDRTIPPRKPSILPRRFYVFWNAEYVSKPLRMYHFGLRYACSSGRLLFCVRLLRPVVLVFTTFLIACFKEMCTQIMV